ncbi:DMT family transporter [Coraliomargarita sp. SDUM461004]|uniref:DMT family transporter n=1 Tax=Thalassobacterium sedimentorum TaxID=3041258 RepID=A0ABU1AEK3_9BACT|nr:DMT family transporter [Coraliomargarita sp. SDUM461004]MDQ8193186.1 DMT family transporter [Coraliomargarita sp. SDUM461004]
MSWIALSICSALLLGLYDLAKKHALRDNAVLPVLFFGILTSGVTWLPFVLWSHLAPQSFPSTQFLVTPLQAHEHVLLFLKSALVAGSWIFGYFALKNLPLSIAGPIRATGPLWTILLAVFLMSESPSPWQWVGIIIVLAAFYAFSFVGKLEGIYFSRDKWIGFMLAATLIGACSAIYDKFLLQSALIGPATVQAWFSLYLVVVMAPFYLLWLRGAWPRGHFEWRWSIPMIGLLLLSADFLYFTAIAQEDALIAVISPIRRGAVVVTFLGGIFLHKEVNFKPKAICILFLLLGIVLMKMGS